MVVRLSFAPVGDFDYQEVTSSAMSLPTAVAPAAPWSRDLCHCPYCPLVCRYVIALTHCHQTTIQPSCLNVVQLYLYIYFRKSVFPTNLSSESVMLRRTLGMMKTIHVRVDDGVIDDDGGMSNEAIEVGQHQIVNEGPTSSR